MRRFRDITIGICLLSCSGGTLQYDKTPVPEQPRRAIAAQAITATRLHGKMIEQNLRSHIQVIAGDIGERNIYDQPENLNRTALYIERHLESFGYRVEHQSYRVSGKKVFNLEATISGSKKPDEIVIVGAHYDSVEGCPAANDNGTGVAALLELARLASKARSERTVRFVAFVNEEPPYFQTAQMGSHVYAKACRERGDHVVAMLSLETLGFYADTPGSQHFPPELSAQFPEARFPDTGNFIAFVGNETSGALVEQCVEAFGGSVDFPAEAVILPAAVPGVGWSDHWSFWQFGYPALMVTDTAPYRYAHYHEPTDTPDKVDYPRTAQVVSGLYGMLCRLTD